MDHELLLQLKNASVHYGTVIALSDASVQIDEGEVVAVMGPNGAGKSTVIKAIFGIAPVTHGEIFWHGQKISPVPHEMPARGIAYVPQGRQVFKNLSVLENLELGAYSLKNKVDAKVNIDAALKFFPALKEKLHAKAGLLSGGQQQMLTIARALVSDPKVLLLDEPSLGLAPKIVKEIFALIKQVADERKIGILIVEHSVASVLSVAHRAYVLVAGKIVYDGKATELTPIKLHEFFLGKK